MAQLLRVCVGLSVFGFIAAGSSSSWSYSDPSHWKDLYEECDGDEQSPICVDLDDVERNRNLGEFEFSGWGELDESGQKCDLTIINNGHSLQVDVGSCSSHISGAGLNGNYHTAQYHFHWGSDDSHGSEHCIDGEYYPMELHIVHYKDEYGSVSNALKYADGLAVIGVFFKVTSSKNSKYEALLSEFSKVPHAGDKASIAHIPLKDFVPSDLSGFYRYSGSLTTPPCSEVVTWTLVKQTIDVSESQINQFRSLIEGENYRPPQSLNGRKVESS